MEPITLFFLVTTVIAILLALVALWQAYRHATDRRQAQEKLIEATFRQSAALADQERLLGEVSEAKAEIMRLGQALLDAEGERSAAVAERDITLSGKKRIEEDIEGARAKVEMADRRASEAEKQAELMRQQMEASQKRMQDWETQRLQSIESAKAAVMEAGNLLSNKLLADHRQETSKLAAENNEKNEEVKKHATEAAAKMFEQFHHVQGRVEAMQRDGSVLKNEMDMVMGALKNPSGAGRMSEIGLENLLKNFGFESPRDFEMQYHISGEEGKLYPDSIVYLPQGTILLIDSKASKHMIELELARGRENEAEVFDQFKRRMKAHGKTLAEKQYEKNFREHYAKSGRQAEIGTILNLMYLPSEAMIARLREEAAELHEQFLLACIHLVGPTTLDGICAFARTRLAEARRMNEHEEIMSEIARLMGNMATAIGHAAKMGKGLSQLSNAYGSFVGSLNKHTLPGMRSLKAMGVVGAREIPANLPRFDVMSRDDILEHEETEGSEKIVSLLERTGN